MPSEPLWLPIDAVIKINQVHITETGESYALLFADRLESALDRPKNEYAYAGVDDVLSLGVKLMFAVASAHAFEQGNKRTGFTSGLVFIAQNGYSYDPPDSYEHAELFLNVVVGAASEQDFELFMVPYISPI